MRNRPAFTLVETLVALILFQFAMLALAAASAVAARDLGAARRLTTARVLARNRVEALAAVSCPSAGSGSSKTTGYAEHWRIDRAGERRLIRDSVVFAKPDGTRGWVMGRAATLCLP